jgi:hypothetical protein
MGLAVRVTVVVQVLRLLLLHSICILDQVTPHVLLIIFHVTHPTSAPCAVAAEVAMWPSAIVDVMYSGASF